MVKIKRKILMDSAVYIVLPILMYSLSGINKFNSYMFYLIVAGIGYTLYTGYKQNRTNASGLSIMILLIFYIYFSKNQEKGFELYIYITYLIGISSGILLLLDLFNKNICAQIYTDILNTKDSNSLSINSLIKKRKLENEFRFLTTLIVLHLLSATFIRFYSIVNCGSIRYRTNFILEILNLTIFVGIELYSIYRIIVKTMDDKASSNKRSLNSLNDGRVINLSQYRRINK